MLPNHKRSALAAAVAAFFLSPSISADTVIDNKALVNYASANKLETVVVVASRRAEPLRQIGASVSVMTGEEIEARGFTSLHDVLRAMTGINVSNNGGAGKATTLRIRGEEGYRTLVLIDGIKVSDPTGTQVQPQIQHLLSSNIGRVEILRGPQGMMYGADAGGVVNIITKQADGGFATDVSAEYGRYNSRSISANTRGKSGIFDYSLSLADLSTDGFNTSSGDTVMRDDDGYDNTTAHFNGGVQITDAVRLDLTLRDTDAEYEYDNMFGSMNSWGTFEQQNHRLQASYERGDFTQRLAIHHSDIERATYFDDHIRDFYTEGSIDEIQYGGSVPVFALGTLVYGVDHEKQKITPSGERERERDQLGGYLEWQGSVADRFFYSAGVRHDDNDDFGEHTSYRLTGAWLIELGGGDVIKLKSSYGTGFRAPSLSEIAYNESLGGGGLGEERSAGYDVGIEYHWAGGAIVEAVYFDQEVKDQVVFNLSNWLYEQDSGTSRSKGIELSATVPLTEQLLFDANYTYNDAADAAGERRTRRPRHVGNLGLHYQFLDGAVKTGVNLRVSRDAIDSGNVKLDDYELVDVNVTWSVNPTVDLYARVENALDENYVEITGYNVARSAAYAGLRLHF